MFSVATCDLCEGEDREIHSTCEECSKYMCYRCDIAHKNINETKHHRVLSQRDIFKSLKNESENKVKDLKAQIAELEEEVSRNAERLDDIQCENSSQSLDVNTSIDSIIQGLEIHRKDLLKQITEANDLCISKLNDNQSGLLKNINTLRLQLVNINKARDMKNLPLMIGVIKDQSNKALSSSPIIQKDVALKSPVSIIKPNNVDIKSMIMVEIDTSIEKWVQVCNFELCLDAPSVKHTSDTSRWTVPIENKLLEVTAYVLNPRTTWNRPFRKQRSDETFERMDDDLKLAFHKDNSVDTISNINQDARRKFKFEKQESIDFTVAEGVLPIHDHKSHFNYHLEKQESESGESGQKTQNKDQESGWKLPFYKQEPGTLSLSMGLIRAKYKQEKCRYTGNMIRHIQVIGNELWCSAFNVIYIYSKECQYLREIRHRNVNSVVGLAQISSDYVFAACSEEGGIHYLNHNGDYMSEIIQGSYASVSHHNNKLLAIEYNKSHVKVLEPEQDLWIETNQFKLGYNKSSVEDRICAYSNGVCISSFENHQLYLYNHQGQLIQTIGEEGLSEPGKLKHPYLFDVADRDNVLMVVDKNNKRIQLYDVCAKQWNVIDTPADTGYPICTAVEKSGKNIWISTNGKKLIKYTKPDEEGYYCNVM